MTKQNDSKQNPPRKQIAKFVPMEGSPVIVGQRDRQKRIQEAIDDFRVAINGCVVQDASQLVDTIASLARFSSIFLRKMILKDRNNPRLLNEDYCRKEGLRFDRIRKIPSGRRVLNLVPVDHPGGSIKISKINEETLQPEGVQEISIGPQRLNFEIQWPLSGMADWKSQPTKKDPWEIRSEELFDSQFSPIISCDEWLGQQVVRVDNRGITLKEIIRTIVNTEGAHSPPVDRLMKPKGIKDDVRKNVVRDKEVFILSHMTVSGIRYSHVVVIETAMYLYEQLVKIQGRGDILKIGIIPEVDYLGGQDWIKFEGGLSASLGGKEQIISHTIKAPR